MSTPVVLRVVHLYPEHLNIYADRGNMMVLEPDAGGEAWPST